MSHALDLFQLSLLHSFLARRYTVRAKNSEVHSTYHRLT